jgi:hypothetical protein
MVLKLKWSVIRLDAQCSGVGITRPPSTMSFALSPLAISLPNLQPGGAHMNLIMELSV